MSSKVAKRHGSIELRHPGSTMGSSVATPSDHCKDDFAELGLRLIGRDLTCRGGMGQGIGSAEHRPKAGRQDTFWPYERGQSLPAFFDERLLVIALDGLQFGGAGKPGEDARNLAALGEHTFDIGRGDDPRRSFQVRFAGLKRGVDHRRLARIEILIERGQQAIAGAEMVMGYALVSRFAPTTCRQGYSWSNS